MKMKLSEAEANYYIYLINVTAAVLNKKSIPRPAKDFSAEEMLKACVPTAMDALFSDAMLGLKTVQLTQRERGLLNNYRSKAIAKDFNQAYEIDKILCAFDEYKIKNMPLKGYFLKKEYPQSYYRYMSDFDVLVDAGDIADVKRLFSQLGYSFESNDDNQYHFIKKPYMYVEVHTSIVHDYEPYYPYVKDILDRSVEWGKYEYSRNMRCEDFYLYMLIHTANHFRLSGVGIRMIADIYVYYKNLSHKFDMKYLYKMLGIYNLASFEKKLRELAFKWFSSDKSVSELDEAEEFIFLSGLIGTTERAVMINSVREMDERRARGRSASKLNYLLKSLFPPSDKLAYKYTYLNRHKALLPVAWASMWGRRFFVERNVHVKRGFSSRLGYTDENLEHYKKISAEFGLED